MAEFSRHDLVTVDPAIWPSVIAGHDLPLLVGWAARRWPAIVRRPGCRNGSRGVPVGIPLPPELGKARIALSVPESAILAISPPPALRDAASAAPPEWRTTIATLLAALPALRCFGSLAWQHLTGLAYIAPTSDLDLLVDCPDGAAADKACVALEAAEAAGAVRIDAELVSRARQAVHWREWLNATPEVLAKDRLGTRLIPRAEFFA